MYIYDARFCELLIYECDDFLLNQGAANCFRVTAFSIFLLVIWVGSYFVENVECDLEDLCLVSMYIHPSVRR